MSTTADRNTPSAAGGAAKPAASLLTVPIFRDRRDRRRHNGSGYAGGEGAERAPQTPCAESEGATSPPGGGEAPESNAQPPLPDADAEGRGEAAAAGLDETARVEPPDAVPAVAEAEPDRVPGSEPDPTPEWPGVDAAPMVQEVADAPTAAPRPDPAPVPKRFRDLKQYWRWLRYGDLPEVDALDPGLIARNWPHSMLIRVPEDGLLDIVRVFAPNGGPNGDGADASAAATGHPFAGDRLSQVSTWVLELARGAAAQRQPSEARESFQLDAGSRTFAVQLLPCVRHDDPAAYVLLHVHEA